MSLVTRSNMRSFMMVNGRYCEIGGGFTDFTESKNPIEYSRQYINEATERTDIVGFAPSVTYAFDVLDADEVQGALMEITVSEALGDAAVVSVVTAFLHNRNEDGYAIATRREYTVCPGKLGQGTEALIVTGTLKACGDPTYGVFDTDALEFIEW